MEDTEAHLKRSVLACLVLVTAVFSIYAQLWRSDFIAFDDNTHVYENPAVVHGLSQTGIVWAFTHFHGGQWVPLTWISHMADVSLFGLDPGAHHLVSVAIHAANALILFAALGLLGISFWERFFVAALFAVHPLNVESVAWIAERKNVLSTTFWLLAMWAYGAYVKRPSNGRMAAVAISMILGLMCKGMLVTLPFTLVLLDFWPLGRLAREPKRILLEKIPLFLIAIGFSLVTAKAAAAQGAIHGMQSASLLYRICNVLTNYPAYLAKLIAPSNFAILYPLPKSSPWEAAVIGTIVLATVTGIAWRYRRVLPAALSGWLWFLGTLFPVSGIVQLGKTAFCERYTYIPQIGLFMGVASFLALLIARHPRYRRIIGGASALAIMTFAAISYGYAAQWQSTETIFAETIRSTEDNFYAHGTLGWALARQGKLDSAAQHYQEALRINPKHAEARANLGVVLSRRGQIDEAIAQFRQALADDPSDYSARYNLSTHLILTEHFSEAFTTLEQLISDDPTDTGLRYWAAKALIGLRNQTAALKQVELAETLLPEDPRWPVLRREIEKLAPDRQTLPSPVQ